MQEIKVANFTGILVFFLEYGKSALRFFRRVGAEHFIFFGISGPYSGFDKSGKKFRIPQQAVKCFPDGIPKHNVKWKKAKGVSSESYISLTGQLFKRSPPECLTNRWYSSDIASWFYLLMWRFSILEHAVPLGTYLSWWPGMQDHTRKDDKPDRDKKGKLAKKKSLKTAEFARSEDCVKSFAPCCVSSVPRWVYARALESKSSGDAAKYCIVEAKHAMFEKTKNIILGGDPLAELLILGEHQPDLLRCMCAKSLLASLLYVLYSDRKYSSQSWKIARGESDLESVSNLPGSRKCCDETGFGGKAAAFAKRADDQDSMPMRESLVRGFQVCRKKYTEEEEKGLHYDRFGRIV